MNDDDKMSIDRKAYPRVRKVLTLDTTQYAIELSAHDSRLLNTDELLRLSDEMRTILPNPTHLGEVEQNPSPVNDWRAEPPKCDCWWTHLGDALLVPLRYIGDDTWKTTGRANSFGTWTLKALTHPRARFLPIVGGVPLVASSELGNPDGPALQTRSSLGVVIRGGLSGYIECTQYESLPIARAVMRAIDDHADDCDAFVWPEDIESDDDYWAQICDAVRAYDDAHSTQFLKDKNQ